MGESTHLVCVQLQEQDFEEKKYFTKVMEISNNYYATISFRGMCTEQNISTTFQYFDVFLYVGDKINRIILTLVLKTEKR